MEIVVSKPYTQYMLNKKLAKNHNLTFNRHHISRHISGDRFKTFIRNYLEKYRPEPARYVSITEKFVEMKTYNLERQHKETKLLYVLEGRSY